MQALNFEQALHRMAAYCSRTERCIYDVRRKMDAWEIPEEAQELIILRLKQDKFLDETRYCKAFVNDKSKYNRWGIYKIRFELMKKQIPENLIREALENSNSGENAAQLRLLLEQKRKSVKGKNAFEIRQKLMKFAAGRGFPQDEIEKALFRIIPLPDFPD
ncbi:MAG: RecX family transcriptional regulator [Dysgonamonadaceae bacterium]|jgi:regulatory protein|nr:RecX family transcriptional regulator [Dysgonamonadaceae bacterium]